MNLSPEEIIKKYDNITQDLSDPVVLSNSDRIKQLSIEQSKLNDIYLTAKQILSKQKDISDAETLLEVSDDAEMKKYLQISIKESRDLLNDFLITFAKQIDVSSSDDNRNAILEIRAGTGGDEAALFAQDLYRMYLKYAETQDWVIQQMHISPNGSGGIKEVVFSLSGKNVYGKLKYESGVHRVQRIPATEAAGRIHTSAASVVVLPEVEDVEVQVKDDDIRIDVFRAGGPGGQSVNTTDSAVRITHLPTGLIVTCQDEKSQLKNKKQAMKVLKSRLYEIQKKEAEDKLSQQRKSSIQSGDRSVKIKTYNFPQSRITDHRIKHSWYNLSNVLNGELDELLETTIKQLYALTQS